MVSKENLVKRKLSYIDTLDHEGTAVVSAMLNLAIRVFEHLEITSTMYLYQRVSYTQLILRGAELTKYKSYLTECNESANDLVGDKRTLGDVKAISTEPLWTWFNSVGLDYEGYAYLGFDKCVKSEKDIWFELLNFMWRNHHSFFQDHLK